MDKDGVYRPDRTIRDVYEDGSEAHKYEELGLSPYARIGSLAGESSSEENFKRPSKPKINLHAYTYVGPLVGETLSPADRLVLKPIYKTKSESLMAVSKLPSLMAAAIAYISRMKRVGEETLIAIQKDNRAERYAAFGNAVPVFISFIAVLLLVFAAVVSPDQPVSNPSGGGNQSIGGSSFSNPNIIDNRALFPLSIFQGNGHDNNHKGSGKTSGSSSTNQVAPYKYVSPTYAQPATTPSTPATTPSGGSISVPSNVSQPSSTLTQPVSGSSVLPSSTGTGLPSSSSSGSGSGGVSIPSTSTGGGGSGIPTISTGSGGISTPSTSGSGSSLSVPGVTTPTSMTAPSTSVSSPVSSKPLISTSPTTITLN